jgi:hypothetical protein
MASLSSGSMSEPLNPAIAATVNNSSASTPAALRIARSSFADLIVDQRMDRRRPKRFLYGTRGIIDGAMQRAKIFTVSRQAKRARFNTLYRIYRRNNLQHSKLICRPHALESSAASALGSY